MQQKTAIIKFIPLGMVLSTHIVTIKHAGIRTHGRQALHLILLYHIGQV